MRILILASLIGLTSCSYFFEEKKEETQANLSFGEETGCLADFFDIQFDYITNATSYEAALASTSCVQETLISINKIIVGGENPERVSQAEVHKLLNEVFFKSDPLSFVLIDHAITMKSWIVGGFSDELSKDEINKVIDLLDHWKIFLKDIEPLLPVMHWVQGEGSDEEFEEAFVQGRLILEKLLDQFPETIDPFFIDVVKQFLEELRAYQGYDSIASYVDLFHGIVWLINGSDERIDLKNTVVAFYEFLHSYRGYGYQFESGFEEILENPGLFIIWLDGVIGKISEVLGDDYVLSLEGLELIVQFLVDYLQE